jgi:hypothetical protein
MIDVSRCPCAMLAGIRCAHSVSLVQAGPVSRMPALGGATSLWSSLPILPARGWHDRVRRPHAYLGSTAAGAAESLPRAGAPSR